jgi:hypothetical protein
MVRKKSKNRKNWGLLSFFLFVVGFFGIPNILIKNFVLGPAGLTTDIIILGLKVSPAEPILNAFNFIWGAMIWHSVKQAIL